MLLHNTILLYSSSLNPGIIHARKQSVQALATLIFNVKASLMGSLTGSLTAGFMASIMRQHTPGNVLKGQGLPSSTQAAWVARGLVTNSFLFCQLFTI